LKYLLGSLKWSLSDFEFSGSADEKPFGQIFGILPYIALYTKNYTQAADIYIMGIYNVATYK